MKKIFICILFVSTLIFASCTGARDTAKAESFFVDFLSAVQDGNTAEILSDAPFLNTMSKDQQDVTVVFFRTLSSSDYRLNTKFTGQGKYSINVYIPDATGNTSTYTFSCEKDKNGKWTVLQNFQQTIKIDKISL